MGKNFEYDFTAHPNEAEDFAKRMSKVGMKKVKLSKNKVTFFDPRPIFSNRRKK